MRLSCHLMSEVEETSIWDQCCWSFWDGLADKAHTNCTSLDRSDTHGGLIQDAILKSIDPTIKMEANGSQACHPHILKPSSQDRGRAFKQELSLHYLVKSMDVLLNNVNIIFSLFGFIWLLCFVSIKATGCMNTQTPPSEAKR